MTKNNNEYYKINNKTYKFQRRKFLRTLGLFGAGGIAAVGAKNPEIFYQDAQAAELSSSGFQVDDADADTTDGELASLTIQTAQFDIDYWNFSDGFAEDFEVILSASGEDEPELPDDRFEVASEIVPVEDTPEDTVNPDDNIIGEEYDLIQDLDFEESDFFVENGETQTFIVTLHLDVITRDDNGEPVDAAQLEPLEESETFEVTVSDAGAEVEVTIDIETEAVGDL